MFFLSKSFCLIKLETLCQSLLIPKLLAESKEISKQNLLPVGNWFGFLPSDLSHRLLHSQDPGSPEAQVRPRLSRVLTALLAAPQFINFPWELTP